MTISYGILALGVTIIIGLVGLIYKNVNDKVDRKVDRESHDDLVKAVSKKLDEKYYKETMLHIQKAVDGINGTAKTLKDLAESISKIQNKFDLFITKKDFEYELRLHHSECPAIKEIADYLSTKHKKN